MILNPDSYEKIMSMLESEDVSNHTMAFSILDEALDERNVPYLVMLMRETKRHMPSVLYAKCVSLHIIKSIEEDYRLRCLTIYGFTTMLDIAKKYNADDQAVQFILDKYAVFLQKSILPFRKDVIITLKINDPTREE